MKTIIAGGRNIKSYAAVLEAIAASGWADEITEVVSGGASGVDTAGEIWATHEGIPWRRFEPNYKKYPGNVAPIIRNGEMATYADALILVWDGKSRGSKDMLEKAQARGLKWYEHKVTP